MSDAVFQITYPDRNTARDRMARSCNLRRSYNSGVWFDEMASSWEEADRAYVVDSIAWLRNHLRYGVYKTSQDRKKDEQKLERFLAELKQIHEAERKMRMSNRELATRETTPLAVQEEWEIDLDAVEAGLKKIRRFQKLVRTNLIPDQDYGTIPGTKKPTLYKPGAEKVAKLMGLSDSYEIVEQTEDWKKPFFAYTIRCHLLSIRSGKLVSQGIGQCNSYESKYRYRWCYWSELSVDQQEALKHDKNALPVKWFKSRAGKPYARYRVDNEDIFSQVNTILKMAKKRALVDASLSAGRLSEIFTQDMEDIQQNTKPPVSEGSEIITEFEAEYDLDSHEQPPETMPNQRPQTTPHNKQLLQQLMDSFLRRAVSANIVVAGHTISNKEKKTLGDLVWEKLGQWPKSEDEVQLCFTEIDLKDIFPAEKKKPGRPPKKKEPEPEATEPEDNPQSQLAWHCNHCGKDFDFPTGANNDLCAHCLKKDIERNYDREAED